MVETIDNRRSHLAGNTVIVRSWAQECRSLRAARPNARNGRGAFQQGLLFPIAALGAGKLDYPTTIGMFHVERNVRVTTSRARHGRDDR
jgi:hypothetical protein